MLYREMVESIDSAPNLREDIEWSNFWWDNANSVEKRILLIGDSTARMIRSVLATKSGRAVDLLGTSSGLHDELFVNQVDCFFSSSEYRYGTIFVQVGHHGMIGANGGIYEESDFERFARDLSIFVDYLKSKCGKIVLESIFNSVIPNKKWKMIKFFHIKECYDDEVNLVKERKNEIIKRIAAENDIKFLDINDFMIRNGGRYYHKDHIHYEDKAKAFIVEKMIKEIELE